MKIYEYMKINAWVIKIHWINNTIYKMSCIKPVNKIFKHFRLEISLSRIIRFLGLLWWLSGKESTCQYHWTWVGFLIKEDPTCYGATKPVDHNYWPCALEPGNHNYWTHMLQLLKPKSLKAYALQQEKPPQWEVCRLQLESSPCSLQLEKKNPCSNKGPGQPKVNK